MEQVILKIYEPYTAKWSLSRRLLNGFVQVGEKDITHTPMGELEMTFKIQEELGRTWKTERTEISEPMAPVKTEPMEMILPNTYLLSNDQ